MIVALPIVLFLRTGRSNSWFDIVANQLYLFTTLRLRLKLLRVLAFTRPCSDWPRGTQSIVACYLTILIQIFVIFLQKQNRKKLKTWILWISLDQTSRLTSNSLENAKDTKSLKKVCSFSEIYMKEKIGWIWHSIFRWGFII